MEEGLQEVKHQYPGMFLLPFLLQRVNMNQFYKLHKEQSKLNPPPVVMATMQLILENLEKKEMKELYE